MTLSTGAKVENFPVFARYEAKLAMAQRANKFRLVKTVHACGVSNDRDLNAAKNILRLGRQALAEGSSTLSAQR